MFLIKSTFWLGLAFVVIQPQNFDFNEKKQVISSVALEESKKLLVSQIKTTNCQTLQCSSAKILLLASTNDRTPTNALPMQEAHSQLNAPIPQPRLKRAG